MGISLYTNPGTASLKRNQDHRVSINGAPPPSGGSSMTIEQFKVFNALRVNHIKPPERAMASWRSRPSGWVCSVSLTSPPASDSHLSFAGGPNIQKSKGANQ